jgi:hypothetical protein
MICEDDDHRSAVRDPFLGQGIGARLPFREEDADDVGNTDGCCAS